MFTTTAKDNQNLTVYLSQLESRYATGDFFKKLHDEEDPINLNIRETWLRDGDQYGEYMVVFGRHFIIRACQRIGLGIEVIDAVMNQLANNDVLQAITSHPLFWENNEVTCDDEDGIRAVAVLEEDVPFVCIYECGQSYVYPRTVLKKEPKMFFHKDTAVIMVDKNGVVTHK